MALSNTAWTLSCKAFSIRRKQLQMQQRCNVSMDGYSGVPIAESGLPHIDLAVTSQHGADKSHKRHNVIQPTEAIKLACCDTQA